MERDEGGRSVEREVDEEFAFHIEMRVREWVARGWDEEEARAEAVRRFGDMQRVKTRCRALGAGRDRRMRMRRWWDDAAQDLVFTIRQMRRTPLFTSVVVVTLALAIGATSAVFGVAEAVVLRPLPFPDADRLVAIWTRYLPPSGFDIDKFALSGPELLDLRDTSSSLEFMGATGGGSATFTGDGDRPERIRVGYVMADVFEALGVAPERGRWIEEGEDGAEPAAVIVLGHDLWAGRFGADPSLLGRTIAVNGRATEVIGVMPPGFEFPSGARAWLPMGLDRTNEGGRASHGYGAVGRLRPGLDVAALDAELEVLNAAWGEEYEHNAHHFVWAQDLKSELVGDAPRILRLLLGAVGLVLLVACANVANLLLARGERRLGELGVRTALGAGRGRLVRQMLTESLVLAGAGALLGLGLARGGMRALIALDPTALPRLEGAAVGLPVLLFTAAVAVLTAVAFGLAPAVLVGRRGPVGVAGAAQRVAGGRGRTALRRGLVSVEVALSLVVVVLAGLTARSLVLLTRTDPGFSAGETVTFDLALPMSDYPDAAGLPAAWASLAERLAAVPGVTRVGATNTLPFDGAGGRWDFVLDDRPPRQEGTPAWNARVAIVTPGYFETLGIPVLRGRTFAPSDGPDDARVGVISETMAERTWPDQDPLGKRWGYENTDPEGNTVVEWITVIGVVREQFAVRVDEEIVPQVYLPVSQAGITGYFWPRTLTWAVGTAASTETLVSALRTAVADFDPDLPLARVSTLAAVVDRSFRRPRLLANLLGSFGTLALVLAAVGLYGVVSYSVAGRTREFGVRMALGARRGEVAGLVVREGRRPLLVGIGLGLPLAFGAARAAESLLYGVAPSDPATLAAVAAVLLAVGTGASLIPALRATGVAPTEALREE